MSETNVGKNETKPAAQDTPPPNGEMKQQPEVQITGIDAVRLQSLDRVHAAAMRLPHPADRLEIVSVIERVAGRLILGSHGDRHDR